MLNTGKTEKNNFLKKSIILFTLLLAVVFFIHFQSGKKKLPKLVVGIVVDQMAYDFIPRYWDKYSEKGFKRLINNGFFCKNTKLIHFPSYTAVGHSSIYTGSVPAINGIMGNDWYDRDKEKIVYCADDDTCKTVGNSSNEGNMSPSSLMSSTITDQLMLSNNSKSKVIGIALKDRGSIFPAGHLGSAYWYEAKSKKWITSTYYMSKLPDWVEEFNNKNLPDFYLSKQWNTLLPIADYTESTEDDNNFEDTFKGEIKPVFPHNLPELKYKNPNILRTCPFGNSFTKDFALDAIKYENLGKDEFTDFLCISFSSTDFVGHKFGPNSIEVEDTYLRVDKDIAELLEYLDNNIGVESYLIFLTADHGVCSNPGYLKSKGIQAGTFFTKVILDSVNIFLERTYNKKNLALYFFNQQVYFNYSLIKESGLNLNEIAKNTASYIMDNIEGVENTCISEDLKTISWNEYYYKFFKNGFYEKRCGEVFVNFKQHWIEDRVKGAEHGGPYDYDIHIPLIWYGCGIPKGETSEPIEMVDIAPTLSILLNIDFPSGCIGTPIKEIVDN
ncbi:MAG: alkaline phosphatase family protein [Ignavibacteriae bacterium]|nr:alkaline phosphatase family protein [Ignavibacteriota bacterium]